MSTDGTCFDFLPEDSPTSTISGSSPPIDRWSMAITPAICSLLNMNEPIATGLSGGKDSQALLFPKQGDSDTYMKIWEGMRQVLDAALNS